MNNFIRYYNQNTKKIWRIILIILAIMVLIRMLNYITIINNEKMIKNAKEKSKTNANSIATNATYSTTKSSVTGSNMKTKDLDSVQNILDNFYKNCKNKNLKVAYNLLTDECKELVYPTLESFQKNYYNNVFEGKEKNYNFENWYRNTYFVTIKDDILSTGKVNSDENKINDYVTVVGDKLNINTYVGRTNIDKVNTSKNIKMTVKSKDTFMKYEIYNITVKNESEKIICLTTADDSNDVCIQDSNDIEYGVYNHEIIASQMVIEPGDTKNLSLKFYSSYVSSKKIERLVFKNVLLDNDDNNKKDRYVINF